MVPNAAGGEDDHRGLAQALQQRPTSFESERLDTKRVQEKVHGFGVKTERGNFVGIRGPLKAGTSRPWSYGYTGQQRNLINQLFKTGFKDSALTRETLKNYAKMARNALRDPKKLTDVAERVQAERLKIIEELLKNTCE